MDGDEEVSAEELAKAFSSGAEIKKTNESEGANTVKKAKKSKKGARKGPIAVFCIGVIVLIAGIVVLAMKFMAQPQMADAEFLTTAGEWVREDQPAVIWDFTEVGKGKLTTDGHLNNYDFIWKLEDGKLTIETDWLYDLNDEFSYIIDQGAKLLTITNEEKGVEVKFKAKDRPKEEAKEAEETEASAGDNTGDSDTGDGASQE